MPAAMLGGGQLYLCQSSTWTNRQRTGSWSKRKALITALGNRVAAFAIVVEAAEIDSELSGLARNVGAEIPGICLGIERTGRDFGGVRNPARLGIGRRFDDRETAIAHVHQTIRDPIYMLFDRGRHVGEDRWAERPGDGEEVGKACRTEPEIGSRAARPLVAQPHPAAPAKIDRQQRTRD